MVTWPQLQATMIDDPEHWEQCQSLGIVCPFEVFTQLFPEHAGIADVPKHRAWLGAPLESLP